MKILLSVLLLAAMGVPALAGSDSDLEECARRSDASLCMSKVLLRAIEEGRRPGGPGHGGPGGVLGMIYLYGYNSEESCNRRDNGIAQMMITIDAGVNARVCENAGNSETIGSVGVELRGKYECYRLTYSSSKSEACRWGMKRAGVPI